MPIYTPTIPTFIETCLLNAAFLILLVASIVTDYLDFFQENGKLSTEILVFRLKYDLNKLIKFSSNQFHFKAI
jgi:hypothetical protein